MEMSIAHWLIVWAGVAVIGLSATWLIHKIEEIRKVKPLISHGWSHVITQVLVIAVVVGVATGIL